MDQLRSFVYSYIIELRNFRLARDPLSHFEHAAKKVMSAIWAFRGALKLPTSEIFHWSATQKNAGNKRNYRAAYALPGT
jgi:hypothetical protein